VFESFSISGGISRGTYKTPRRREKKAVDYLIGGRGQDSVCGGRRDPDDDETSVSPGKTAAD